MERVGQLFLAEHYGPGASAEQMAASIRRLESALRSYSEIRLLGALFVPSDELLLCVVAATSAEVARVYTTQAGVFFDRISNAVELVATGPPIFGVGPSPSAKEATP